MEVLAALVFYALGPLLGAWRVRRRWTRFRQDILAAMAAPEIDFPLLQSGRDVPPGLHRLTGNLEAFEGNDRLWIGNDRVSVAVALHHTSVYFLEDADADAEGAGAPPRRVEALALGTLLEGTQFLVSGRLVADATGQLSFAAPRDRLLVLTFEGDPATVLRRALLAGRPLLDHWNAWTPVSAGLGIVVLLVLAFLGWDGAGKGTLALALAFVPSTFFLPPGMVFFYGFSWLWRRGRSLRAAADLVRLGFPRRPGPDPRARALVWETLAHVSLALGIVGNTALLVWLLGVWLLGVWLP